MEDPEKTIGILDRYLHRLNQKQLRVLLQTAYEFDKVQRQHNMCSGQKQQKFPKGGKNMSREEMIAGILALLEGASDLVVEQVYWETQEVCG